jgi:hypothetical protein
MCRVAIESGVRLKEINEPFLGLVKILNPVCKELGMDYPGISSASEKGGALHRKGLAWHVIAKTSPSLSVSLAVLADRLRNELMWVDDAYRVIYGDTAHQDCVHVEYDESKVGGG